MNESPSDPADEASAETSCESERYVARREVVWLTVLGVVLAIVAGVGTWLSRWETVEFLRVEVSDDRFVWVEYTCRAESRFEVEEFDDRVEILLTERPPSDDCDAIPFRCVELDEPLDGRRVVNRGTAADVTVTVARTAGSCDDPGEGYLGSDALGAAMSGGRRLAAAAD